MPGKPPPDPRSSRLGWLRVRQLAQDLEGGQGVEDVAHGDLPVGAQGGQVDGRVPRQQEPNVGVDTGPFGRP